MRIREIPWLIAAAACVVHFVWVHPDALWAALSGFTLCAQMLLTFERFRKAFN